MLQSLNININNNENNDKANAEVGRLLFRPRRTADTENASQTIT